MKKNQFLLTIATLVTVLTMFFASFGMNTAAAAPAAQAEQTWVYTNEAGFKGFELQETVNGTTDVGVDNDLAKADPMLGPIYDAVQGLGYGMRFNTSVSGKVIFGTGTLSVDGELVETRNLENYEGFPVEAGEIVYIPNGPSRNNGARWTPDSGEGWREGNTSSDCPPNDGTCLTISGDTVTWTGDVSGMADIWQGTKEALDAVRAGAVMTIKFPNAMQVIQTCDIKIEQLDLDNGSVLNTFERHNCDEMNVAIKLNPGYYRFSESTGDSGGYRIRPWFGIGWMSNETMPADYLYVVFETLAQAIIDFIEATPENDGPVVALLTDVGGNVVHFKVSAPGTYKLNQQGNKTDEVLESKADENNVVTFTMKSGNTSMQLQNVTMTSRVADWTPCPAPATDWLCLDSAADGDGAVATEEPAADGDGAVATEEPAMQKEPFQMAVYWLRYICFGMLVLVVVVGIIWFLATRKKPSKPVITLEPADQTVIEGAQVRYEANADGATSWLWFMEGKVAPLDNVRVCSFPADIADTGKHVWCNITNAQGAVNTRHALLTVTPVAPTFVSISHADIPLNSPETVVTIKGTNFLLGTPVVLTGTTATATFVDDSTFMVTIPAADLTAAKTITVNVAGVSSNIIVA